MLGFDNKKLNMTGSYMLGFGRFRQINMKEYSEHKRVYEQKIPSLDKLLFNIKVLWGIRFVRHCLNLNGGGHKVVPIIGIKERPTDNPLHNWVITNETTNAGCQNIYGSCHILTKNCQFCFLTQYANGYQYIYGTRQITNNHKYDTNKHKVEGYKLGFKLFGKELRHDEGGAILTHSIVTRNMPKDLTIDKGLRHDAGVAKLRP